MIGFPGCGGIFTAASSEFGSPMVNGEYPHNLVCEYNIRVEKNSKIKLKFLQFKLEESTDCHFDSVEVNIVQCGCVNFLVYTVKIK